MSEQVLQFEEKDTIGRVASVDTSRVYINVDNHTLLTRVSVSNLIAVQGATLQEFLIGITERLTRQVAEEAILSEEDEQGNIPIGEAQKDVIQTVLVGTFRTVEGDKKNVFKRGADSFPQIDRKCYLIEGANLQRLMNLLSFELKEEERLQLGRYVADRSAIAVADGNRFFQRHASVLGSTGAGKSWAVGLILERANALKYPNLILFDMHGEYKPMNIGKGEPRGFARGFRVAGPGDLDKTEEDVVFLPYWLLNREEMLAMLLDRSDQNAPNQAARLTSHIHKLKEETLKKLNKGDVISTFTVDSPIPYDIKGNRGQSPIFSLSCLVYLPALGLPRPSHSFRPLQIGPPLSGLKPIRCTLIKGVYLESIMADACGAGNRKSDRCQASGRSAAGGQRARASRGWRQ